jgi:glycine cleavage system H protein
MIAILVITLIVCALSADYVVQGIAERAFRLSAAANLPPEALHADRNHLWVWPEPSGVARIGVDPVAATLLGSPERIEWPASGKLARGAPLAVVHAHGRRVTLRSPVDGAVVERNPLLTASPAAMASQPLGEGWLVRLRPANLAAELANLKSGEQLRAWWTQEMDRLRELVLSRLPASAAVGATAADGGPLASEAAARLDEAAFVEAARMILGDDVMNQEPASATGPRSECA